MNAGIQGLAADIFKAALVRLDARLAEEGLRSRLILQVHDEVLLEVPPDEEEAATKVTLEAMQGAALLSVPLEVNVSWGAQLGGREGLSAGERAGPKADQGGGLGTPVPGTRARS